MSAFKSVMVWGKEAAAVMSIIAVITATLSLMTSDTPILASGASVAKLSQNFDAQQKQLEQLSQHQKQSDKTQASVALIIYIKQRNDAIAQIEAAKKEGKRDTVAEALRDSADQLIMETLQVQAAAK